VTADALRSYVAMRAWVPAVHCSSSSSSSGGDVAAGGGNSSQQLQPSQRQSAEEVQAAPLAAQSQQQHQVGWEHASRTQRHQQGPVQHCCGHIKNANRPCSTKVPHANAAVAVVVCRCSRCPADRLVSVSGGAAAPPPVSRWSVTTCWLTSSSMEGECVRRVRGWMGWNGKEVV
jgi:hypothetical protein